MQPELQRLIQRRRFKRRLATIVFRVSALVLVGCFAAIVGFPDTVGYSAVYWVALGAAFVCVLSAALLGKWKSEEAAGDALWLLRFRDRDARPSWDLDADD